MEISQKTCWLELLFQYYKGQKTHCNEFLRKPKDLDRAITKLRKKYLGSDLLADSFVRTDNKPDEDAIEELSCYLAKRANKLMQKDYPDRDIQYEETFFYPFFRYAFWVIAEGHIAVRLLMT